MRKLVLLGVFVLSVVCRAECDRALAGEAESLCVHEVKRVSGGLGKVGRAAAIALVVASCSAPGPQNGNDPANGPSSGDDWRKAPRAEAVARGNASIVYRFTDDFGGQKRLCYFVDSYYGSDSGRGGITCTPIP